jgi:hypothetical protein
MKILLFHGLPSSPAFWLAFLAFIVFSIFLVILGVFRFVKSDRKVALARWGSIVFLVLMAPSIFLDYFLLPTAPFGFAAVMIPLLVLSGGPSTSVGNPLIVYIPIAIGCALNIVAWFCFVDLIVNLWKRLLGTGGNSDRRMRLR